MSEPTLEDITDYDTLTGSKKKIVWGVILVGLVIGIVYVVSYSHFSNVNDSIPVEKSIKSIPVK